MMRSPYRSPEGAAPRYLRVAPRETSRRKRLVLAGVAIAVGWLAWSFIGTDSGLLRIDALRRENEALRSRKEILTVRAAEAEKARKAAAKDPLLEERVARERFHLVKKDETVYFYRDASEPAGAASEDLGDAAGTSSGPQPRGAP